MIARPSKIERADRDRNEFGVFDTQRYPFRFDDPIMSYDPAADVLEQEWERLWYEIRRLLPRYRVLYDAGPDRTPDQANELIELDRRVIALRKRTTRYREILRNEEIARQHNGVVPREPIANDPGPTGTPVLKPRWPGDDW